MAYSASLGRAVHRKTGDTQYRQRIARQPSAPVPGQIVNQDFGGGYGTKADDRFRLHRHVGNTEMMSKLVLAGAAMEEPVEIVVPLWKRLRSSAGAKARISIVTGKQFLHGLVRPLVGFQTGKNPLAGVAVDYQARGYHDLLRQVAEGLEVVQQGLLDDDPFDAASAHVAFQPLSGFI
jgi:hypothetical protein